MTELKPCPFCGNAAYPGNVRYSNPLADATWADGSEIIEAHYVNCGTCQAANRTSIAGGHRTVAEAEGSWNRRIPLEPVNANLLEALLCAYAHVKEIAEGNAHTYQEPRLLQMVKDDLKQIEQAISLAEKSNG